MRNYLSIFFVIIGTLVVLYLSWVSSPKIGGNPIVPNWMGSWVDSHTYFTIRTAIPMFFLGGMSGIIIQFNRLKKTWWLYSWMLLTLVVVIAEIGQFLRPLRTFDIEDIIMGSAGAGLGLITINLMTMLFKSFKG